MFLKLDLALEEFCFIFTDDSDLIFGNLSIIF